MVVLFVHCEQVKTKNDQPPSHRFVLSMLRERPHMVAVDSKRSDLVVDAETHPEPEALNRKARRARKRRPFGDKITVPLDEVAHITGLSRITIYELIEEGKLKSVGGGGRRLVTMESIRRLLHPPD